MKSAKPLYCSRAKGMAYVLTLVLLVVCSTLAVGFAAGTNMNLLQSDNALRIHKARLRAESGIDFYVYVLRGVSLPADTTAEDLMETLAAALDETLNDTPNLAGQAVAYNAQQIVIPQIAFGGEGGGFQAVLTPCAGESVELTVTGSDSGVVRRARMRFDLVAGRSEAFDYGLATQGKIVMSGNARILGANNPSEANVLTGTYSDLEAASLTGSVELAGDLSLSNTDAHATLTGNVTIGGQTTGGAIEDHVHVGVGGVEFPEPDPTVFEPFARTTVDAGTNTGGNQTFVNIRIVAHANPTFSGNITLKGVIYIESPNQVTFTGNLNLTGVIVTEDAGEGAVDKNSIHFSGNTTALGVESLPKEPKFAGLREMTGTFMLAPGFSVKFTGNFGTINGTMAADEFKWAGNAGGTIRGSIIGWGDYEFNLTGNSHLVIDRSGSTKQPPGFAAFTKLVPRARTYEEL